MVDSIPHRGPHTLRGPHTQSGPHTHGGPYPWWTNYSDPHFVLKHCLRRRSIEQFPLVVSQVSIEDRSSTYAR